MKLMTGILAVVMMAGAAGAQNPDAIDNTRSVAKSLQQIQTTKTNEALDAAAGVPAQTAQSSDGAPAPAAKPAKAVPHTAAKSKTPAKPHDAFAPKKPVAAAAKVAGSKPASKSASAVTTKIAAVEKPTVVSHTAVAPAPPKPEEKKWAMDGKRDPFFSPVVQQTGPTSCSTGKKCLEIGQINLRGVVKSESGFIAVVTNSLNKAYFLHESDPVFNGYVVKITGDSVVFQETVQDKLGKPLTREVTKKLSTPAV